MRPLIWLLAPGSHWRRPIVALALLAGLFALPTACESGDELYLLGYVALGAMGIGSIVIVTFLVLMGLR